MKALLLAAVTLCGLSSQAREIENFKLINIVINPSSYSLPQPSRLAGAEMTINHSTREVTLVFHQDFYCPANAICPMVMPAPVIITLPITQVIIPFCGGRIIEAELDRRPMDGLRQAIQIYDDNGNVCERDPRQIPLKNLHVSFAEQSLLDATPIVSTFEALPLTFEM